METEAIVAEPSAEGPMEKCAPAMVAPAAEAPEGVAPDTEAAVKTAATTTAGATAAMATAAEQTEEAADLVREGNCARSGRMQLRV